MDVIGHANPVYEVDPMDMCRGNNDVLNFLFESIRENSFLPNYPRDAVVGAGSIIQNNPRRPHYGQDDTAIENTVN